MRVMLLTTARTAHLSSTAYTHYKHSLGADACSVSNPRPTRRG